MKKMVILFGAIALVGFGYLLGAKKVSQQDDFLFSVQAASSATMLSYSEEELMETFEDTDKLDIFLALHEDLVEVHQRLMTKHQDLRTLRQQVVDERNAFRASDQNLSREDGIILWNNYHDLLDLKEEFKQTYGLAYQRLMDLKGQYSRENIDLIIETYEDVIAVLIFREVLIDQALNLMNQSLIIYQTV